MAGYSTTPLLDKLGIKEEMKVLLINPPENYSDLVGRDLSNQLVGLDDRPDFVHLFVTSATELKRQLPCLLKIIYPTSIIWVSWYKKSTGISTDVTEDVIRNEALKTILVDVKVCAVSDIWSGLKLVVRKENRNFLHVRP